MDDKITSMSR